MPTEVGRILAGVDSEAAGSALPALSLEGRAVCSLSSHKGPVLLSPGVSVPSLFT